jgi:hypothetical protein
MNLLFVLFLLECMEGGPDIFFPGTSLVFGIDSDKNPVLGTDSTCTSLADCSISMCNAYESAKTMWVVIVPAARCDYYLKIDFKKAPR